MFKRLLALLFPRAAFLFSRAKAFLFLCATALVVFSVTASATTTVKGNFQNLVGGSVSAGTFVRFYLRGCAGNQPRANGVGINPTAIIAPTLGNVYYFDIVPNSSGAIPTGTTIYSTRDASGVGPGDIECGGSLTAVWYGMQPYVSGKAGPETPIHANNGATIDISTVLPITAMPVVTAAVGLTQLTLPGSISGFTTIRAEPVASGVLTVPAATDTLVGQSTTDTLLNKTLVTATLTGTTTNNIMNSSSLGSATNPIYSFKANPNTGFYVPSFNVISAAVGGVDGPMFSQNGISFGADGQFINFGLARDTSLSRLSAGVLAVGNGNQGDTSGSLNLSRVLAGDGSAAAPSYSFSNQTGTGTGIYRDPSTGHAVLTISGTKFAALGNGWVVPSTSVYDWSSVADPNATVDTGFSRAAAGVVAVGNGNPGDASGTLKAATVNATSGFQINGTALAAANLSNGVTGSGLVVLQTSPVLIGPQIGNASGSSLSVTGTIGVTQAGSGVSMSGGTPAIVFSTGAGGGGTATLAGAPVGGQATTITLQSGVNDTIVNRTSTDTLTNKRVTSRVVSLPDGTSFTLSTDNADMNTQVNTQAAGTLTANAPAGTPTDGQRLMFRIKSTNVQSYSWNAIFRGSTNTSPLPTATTGGGKTDYVGFIFNAADNKWDCIAVDMGH